MIGSNIGLAFQFSPLKSQTKLKLIYNSRLNQRFSDVFEGIKWEHWEEKG